MDVQTLLGAVTYKPKMAVQPALSLEKLHSKCPYKVQLMDSPPSTILSGPLGRLPLELTFNILEQLPILSLLQFRNTCPYAKYLVDSMSSFRAVVQHALPVLYNILILNPSKDISLSDLVSILRRTKCDFCGATAQNVWVPTASRICLACMRSKTIFSTMDELVGLFGPSGLEISTLVRYPFAEASFGPYSSHGVRTHTQRTTFANTMGLNPIPRLLFDYEIPEVWELVLPSDRREVHGRLMSPIPGITKWWLALLAVPWMIGEKVERGYHCSTCLYTADQDRIYTSKEFEEHLETCRVRPFDPKSINRKKRWTRNGRHFLEVFYDRRLDDGW